MNEQSKQADAETPATEQATEATEASAGTPAQQQSLTPEALEIGVERQRFQELLKSKDETIATLQEEIGNLRNQISIATQGAGVPSHLAALVAEKMRAGLSREDAIEVATKQVAHDEQLAKQEKLAADAKKRAEAEAKKAEAAAAKQATGANRNR